MQKCSLSKGQNEAADSIDDYLPFGPFPKATLSNQAPPFLFNQRRQQPQPI